jgi:hypothetical protein
VIAKLRLPRYYQAMLNSVNRPQNKGLLNEIRGEAKKRSSAPVMAVKRSDSSPSSRRLIKPVLDFAPKIEPAMTH